MLEDKEIKGLKICDGDKHHVVMHELLQYDCEMIDLKSKSEL